MDLLVTIVPVFMLILTGFLLRRFEFPSKQFWPQVEQLTYYVLFPALLIEKLGNIHLTGQPVLQMGAAFCGAICCVGAILILLRPRIQTEGPAFTSIFQGSIRPNTYIGLSIVDGLFGDLGLSLAAVVMMPSIPLVNVLCVSVLERHGQGHGKGGIRATVIQLFRNPLILGCLAGFTINALGIRIPTEINEGLHILGGASLPLGLLSVGAGLSFRAALNGKRDIIISSVFRLLMLPAFAFTIATLLGVTGTPLVVTLVFAAIPVSVSSFILARVLGGDHDLMAAIITVQTMLSALTMPVVLWFAV
ncbi:MAG TPA: AEC family transporter [Desulfomicrobiaceae bacterium]|nr:AEC family transporter [Desulfomicrobiaceae bacterium]